MKLNPDCIRDILLQTEQGRFFIFRPIDPSESNDTNLKKLFFLSNYSYDEILYHLNQCYKMNYIVVDNRDLDHISINDLEPLGHSFLANIRENNNWSKTKEIANKIGSLSLETLQQIASNLITALISDKFK
ncbi:MAG: DUF2513 domain-containing protein [Fusobacteriales bacterium]|jgi:hypothetical protein|nr:DUF2513 domain-containing protein [Fusobacteriales bacterium]